MPLKAALVSNYFNSVSISHLKIAHLFKVLREPCNYAQPTNITLLVQYYSPLTSVLHSLLNLKSWNWK